MLIGNTTMRAVLHLAFQGTRHLTAGFHWDHLQNLHAVISGKKEVRTIHRSQIQKGCS